MSDDKLFKTDQDLIFGTVFSEDRRYRYVLERCWNSSLPAVAFIGLNPSIADEECDDMTIRKCVGFAKRWNYGRLFMVNLFAFISTNPDGLSKAYDDLIDEETLRLFGHAFGAKNEYWLRKIQERASLVVAAWGDCGLHTATIRELCLDVNLACLGKTKNGSPRHPSRIAYATELEAL